MSRVKRETYERMTDSGREGAMDTSLNAIRAQVRYNAYNSSQVHVEEKDDAEYTAQSIREMLRMADQYSEYLGDQHG